MSWYKAKNEMKHMKTYIKIFAGLGNQIFQYCHGLYQESHGKKTAYILSKTFRNGVCNDLPEIFTLSGLNGSPCRNILAPSEPLKQPKLILLKIWAKYFVRSYETGFYQWADHIAHIDSIKPLRECLRFTREEQYAQTDVYHQIESCASPVSIHIRGGDYLTAAGTYGGICTAEYYRKAISFILEKEPDAHFFVFSNDKEYCSSIMQEVSVSDSSWSYVIDEDNLKDDAGYDLFLMSRCRHNIIANSTYSWWGAFLNGHKDKIVVTPSKWTNDGNPSLEEIKPDSWISL